MRHGNGVNKEKLSMSNPTAKKKCSLDSTCSEESGFIYMDGPEYLLHKEHFLMHNKKQSLRSQSSDTNLNQKMSTVRRSSSAVSQRLFSSSTKSTAAKQKAERFNSLGCENSPKLGDRRSEKTILAKAFSAGNSRNPYSGSHTTSSLPRRMTLLKTGKRNVEKSNQEFFSGDEPKSPQFSFIGENSQCNRKQSMIHGRYEEELGLEKLETSLPGQRSRKQSPSPTPRKCGNHQSRRTENKESAAKKTAKASSTAPIGRKNYDNAAPGVYRSLPRRPKSSTAPIVPIKKTPCGGDSSSGLRPRFAQGDKQSATQEVSINSAGSPKNVTTIKITKTTLATPNTSASQCPNIGEIKKSVRDVIDLEGEMEGTKIPGRVKKPHHHGSDMSIRSSSSNSKQTKAQTRAAITGVWLQYKSEVENAMQFKPDHGGQYKVLKEMLTNNKVKKVKI